VSYEQAAIRFEKEKEFAELKSALDRIFAADRAERFLEQVQSKRIRIRDFEIVIASGTLERLDQGLSLAGARKLYEALTVSDQAQMREFYLSKLEEVSPTLRAKYQKIYRYY
jgi:hypothetical protein